MMVTHKQLSDYMALLIEQKMVELYQEEKGNIYAKEYRSRYESNFQANLKHMPDDAGKFTGSSAILVISLYQTLVSEKLSIEGFTDIFMSVYGLLMKDTLDGMIAAIKITSNPFKSYVEMFSANPSPYDNEYFKQETLQTNEQGYHLDIHRCQFFEIFKDNGLPELGPVMCEYDLLYANALESWVKFVRNETIAKGDKKCTFRYYPK